MSPWVWLLTLAFFLALDAAIAHDQSHWLTMVGTPGKPDENTIEVRPASFAATANPPSLDIRVNRSAPSVSSEGIPFRSYMVTILVDCGEKTARFTTASFYMMPMWEGQPDQ